ncbi:MAG: hypothetical protein ACXABO_03450 [Promethearchaeota archaeon]|jgi:hypothetical protein
MADYALMFKVLEGGIVDPIKWGKDSFMPDTSIIVMDEGSESLFLWHGVQQGLVARRTALRQAESLKGHGYTVGKSIIGRDIKKIKEIDARKVGKVPEETELNEELQALLSMNCTELENFIVTFQTGVVKPISKKPIVKDEPKVEGKPEPPLAATRQAAPVKQPTPLRKVETVKTTDIGSEYEEAEPLPSITPVSKPAPAIQITKTGLATDAKIAFVFSAILNYFDDIWISKKQDGSFSVEEMDGPICTFSLKEGEKINFSANSFTSVDPKIKTAIQKKFIELSKLI